MFGRRGRKKKPTAQTPTKEINPKDTIGAVSKLKGTQGNLEKRVDFLRKKADRQFALAKQANSQGKRDQALHNLKRKKILEKEIKTLESSILTIEEQVLRIEGGAAVSDVYEALQLANKTMKAVNQKVDPDKLAELMGDIEDLNADMDEVDDILNQNGLDALEDEELLEEFEKLDGDRIEEDAFGALAAVPKTKAEQAEDKSLLDDLAALETLVAPTKKPAISPPVPVSAGQASEEDEELAQLKSLMLA